MKVLFTKKVFVVLVLLSVLARPAFSAEVITGVVKDSLTGAALSAVKVKSSSPIICSTTTNASGQFTLNIPSTTTVLPSGPQTARIAKIVWNSDQGAFLFLDQEMEIKVKDARGVEVARFSSVDNSAKRLPAGVYVASWKASAFRGAFKFFNFPGSSQSFFLSERGGREQAAAVAKSAVYSYNLSFAKEGYNGAVLSAPSGANLNVKLAPKGATANIKVTADSLGTLTIKVEY